MAISQPDILIQSPQGNSIAVVEAKNRQNLSRDIATAFRRTMLAHGLLSQTPYFLLTSQDIGFLWKEAKEEKLDALPNYEFSMDNVVSRYVKRKPRERLHGPVLDLVMFQGVRRNPLKSQKEHLPLLDLMNQLKGPRLSLRKFNDRVC